jgi:hypothetical protein
MQPESINCFYFQFTLSSELEWAWSGVQATSRHFSGCQNVFPLLAEMTLDKHTQWVFPFNVSWSWNPLLTCHQLPAIQINPLEHCCSHCNLLFTFFSTPKSRTVSKLIQKCFNYPLLCSVNIIMIRHLISPDIGKIPKSKHSGKRELLRRPGVERFFFRN